MKNKIILIVLLILGLIWRLIPLAENHSFWTDEDHVAIFSRAIIERGRPVLANGYSTGVYQWLQYWTSAISAKIFGLNEYGMRLPSVFFGVFTILAVYLLGKELFGKKVGLLSAFLIAFLNIEILFSRQVRPYQALQFFCVLGSYFSVKILKNNNVKKSLFWLTLCGILSPFFHFMGAVFLWDQLIFLLILQFKHLTKKKIFLPLITLLTAFIFLYLIIKPKFSNVGNFNNFYYYRVFLTHNYLLLCLLAVLGGVLLIWRKNYRELLLFVISLGVQIVIVSFFLSQPFTRYFYPVFPFIILLASYGVLEIGNWLPNIIKIKILSKRFLISFFLVFLVIFSLWKTGKISLLPKKIYSLNADMQEIPEVDWKKIYGFVDQGLKTNPKAILVANWMDTPVWFLGEGKLNYLIRKSELDVDAFSGAKYLNSLEKFIFLTKENPKGYIVLDSWDPAVPEGVHEYCQENLKKEFEIDRLYPVQPRYWTVWVYSWGLNND